MEKDIRVGSSLRKLKPSDIAILVRRRKDADGLMEELTKRQIRFIIQSDERVLESQEAQDIAAILSAMENPKSLSAMTKARVTPIFGHSIKLIEEDVQASLLARERIEKANERAKNTVYSLLLQNFLKNSKLRNACCLKLTAKEH